MGEGLRGCGAVRCGAAGLLAERDGQLQRCDAAVGAFLGAAPGAIPSTAALGGTGARSSGQLREERGGKTHGQLGSSATFHQKSPPSPIPCCPRLDCFIARSRIPLRHRAEPIELPGPRIGLCPWARGIRRPRCEARGGGSGGSEPIGALSLPAPPAPPALRHGSEQRRRDGAGGRGPGSGVGWGPRRCRGLQGPPRPHPRCTADAFRPDLHGRNHGNRCSAAAASQRGWGRRAERGRGGGERGRGCGAVTALLLRGGRPAGLHRWDRSRGHRAVATVQRGAASPRDRVQPIPAGLPAPVPLQTPRVRPAAQCAAAARWGAAPFPPLSAPAVCSLAAVPSRLCPHVNL